MSRPAIEIEVNIEADKTEPHKRWAVAHAMNGDELITFKERVPLHILILPQDDQVFHMQKIARALKKKVDKYFRNPLIKHKTWSLKDDKASSSSPI